MGGAEACCTLDKLEGREEGSSLVARCKAEIRVVMMTITMTIVADY